MAEKWRGDKKVESCNGHDKKKKIKPRQKKTVIFFISYQAVKNFNQIYSDKVLAICMLCTIFCG